MKTFGLFALTIAIAVGCQRREDRREERLTALGSGISITLDIRPECQAQQATVSLSAPHSTQAYNTQSVPHGGTAFFQVTPGTYTLSARTTTGVSCQVSQTVQTLTQDVTPFNICLGSTCGHQQAQYGQTGTNGLPCSWGVYGCLGHMYPGYGNVGVGKPNIYFTVKKPSSIELDLDYTEGNNTIAAIPSLGMNGWKGTIEADGGIRVENALYEYLFYDAQVDEKKLQFSDGFCADRSLIVEQMAEYLTLHGFSQRPVDEFRRHWTMAMPPNPTLCAFPQHDDRINTAVRYRTNTALHSRRLWFILVPQLEEAVSRIRPIPKSLSVAANKPLTDALASAKKAPVNRTVASDQEILAEEWGIGFLLER